MKTLALDIGGANLKAAHSDGPCRSMPFALWKQPAQLASKLAEFGFAFDALAVTMTGELCDCFATRHEGVRAIVESLRQFAADREVAIWSVTGRFVTPTEAIADPLPVASANWHALATWVAKLYPDENALLVDIGSTTTDCITLHRGRPKCEGLTDHDRLRSGELVYLGARRTTLAALGPWIEWRGRPLRIMAEHFATTADVYILLGKLPENAEDRDTADGRPLTREYAAGRVLRMIGADLGMLTMKDAEAVAQAFDQRVKEQLQRTIGSRLDAAERVITSGSGAFLIAEQATDELRHRLGDEGSTAACAYALLQLSQ